MIKKFFLAAILALASCSSFATDYTATFQTGHTGFWFDPTASGNGVALTVDEAGLLGVAVFGFLTAEPEKRNIDPRQFYAVGSTQTTPGQIAIIETSMALGGTFFDLPATETIPAGFLILRTIDCETMRYTVELAPLDLDEESTIAAGTLKKLTGGGGTCTLECQSPGFSPPNPNCPGL